MGSAEELLLYINLFVDIMDFGSEYVYAYDDSEEECVSDQEFEFGMTPNLRQVCLHICIQVTCVIKK